MVGFALDHRGHGRSEGRRAVTDSLDWLLADLGALVDRATGIPAGTRPVLLGHSMGGGIAAVYAVAHQSKLSALVLSAPALGLRATLPGPRRTALKAVAVLAPNLGTVTLEAVGVSRDPLVVTAYETDPLNQGSRDLDTALPGPDATPRVYGGLYHELFNEPERDEVLADLTTWPAAHRPTPTGA